MSIFVQNFTNGIDYGFPIIQNPDGALTIGLSLFPVTSIVTIATRTLFREVPLWQIGASAAVSLASGIAMAWVAAKAFRAGMLLYGQRLNWRALFRRTANGVTRSPVTSGSRANWS